MDQAQKSVNTKRVGLVSCFKAQRESCANVESPINRVKYCPLLLNFQSYSGGVPNSIKSNF